MRILFLTTYYPPCNYGWGYMQLCEEVADDLFVRGHAVAMLTSTHRDGEGIGCIQRDHEYPYENPVCQQLLSTL